ncbi:hypothetical protein DFH07DRAFT_97897 [Mycena maculata]|uniref:Coenzyme Q-binding protein COQ10 START domain-containing protein n=1 Tax=Mycena maculata TaxID=230809 RepID=A0AAD7I8S5_9AGAR|nr:hypothetical protein DFH07DRAFT_97897 [Mycena maculata]
MPSSSKSIPLESEWPTYISTSVVIDAPRDKVWDILVDFAAYAKWNPYIRESTLLDKSKKSPVHSREITKGDHVALKVHMPPAMDDSVKLRAMTELVLHVEPHRQLGWGSHLPGWFFGAEHWNVLSEVGEGRTKFEIIAVFSGAGPYVMLLSMREPFTDAIKAMAQGLKTRCEES